MDTTKDKNPFLFLLLEAVLTFNKNHSTKNVELSVNIADTPSSYVFTINLNGTAVLYKELLFLDDADSESRIIDLHKTLLLYLTDVGLSSLIKPKQDDKNKTTLNIQGVKYSFTRGIW